MPTYGPRPPLSLQVAQKPLKLGNTQAVSLQLNSLPMHFIPAAVEECFPSHTAKHLLSNNWLPDISPPAMHTPHSALSHGEMCGQGCAMTDAFNHNNVTKSCRERKCFLFSSSQRRGE